MAAPEGPPQLVQLETTPPGKCLEPRGVPYSQSQTTEVLICISRLPHKARPSTVAWRSIDLTTSAPRAAQTAQNHHPVLSLSHTASPH